MKLLRVLPETGSGVALRTEDGAPLPFPIGPDPTEDGLVLLDSVVSGGDFSRYLRDAMARYHGKVCLYLRPVFARFSLPCPDGQGEEIPPVSGKNGVFSPTLCANWRLEESWILYDDDDSIREKYRRAEDAGVPYLAVDDALWNIVKTP